MNARDKTSINAKKSHDRNGNFAKGNKCGRGNPHMKAVARFRAALIKAITPEDIASVIRLLKRLALSGDVAAIKLFLEYTLGNSAIAWLEFSAMKERITAIENRLNEEGEVRDG